MLPSLFLLHSGKNDGANAHIMVFVSTFSVCFIEYLLVAVPADAEETMGLVLKLV